MQLFNLILFWTFIGILTSHLAKKRGRHPVAWFSIGFLLSFFGLLVLFLLPKKNVKNPQTARPRIAIKWERSDAWIKLWYYLDPTHKQQGPLEFPDFIKSWKQKKLNERTYVWGEGMKEWKPLSELPELVKEMDQV